MKKFLFLIVALVLIMVLYLVIRSGGSDKKTDVVVRRTNISSTKDNLQNYSEGNIKRSKLTMKQIDSMSANLNYKFTKNNRIADSIAAGNNAEQKKGTK